MTGTARNVGAKEGTGIVRHGQQKPIVLPLHLQQSEQIRRQIFLKKLFQHFVATCYTLSKQCRHSCLSLRLCVPDRFQLNISAVNLENNIETSSKYFQLFPAIFTVLVFFFSYLSEVSRATLLLLTGCLFIARLRAFCCQFKKNCKEIEAENKKKGFRFGSHGVSYCAVDTYSFRSGRNHEEKTQSLIYIVAGFPLKKKSGPSPLTSNLGRGEACSVKVYSWRHFIFTHGDETSVGRGVQFCCKNIVSLNHDAFGARRWKN